MYSSIVDIDKDFGPYSVLFHLKGTRIFIPFNVIDNTGIGSELRACSNRDELRKAVCVYGGGDTKKVERIIDDILWDIATCQPTVNHYFNNGELKKLTWFMAFEPKFVNL